MLLPASDWFVKGKTVVKARSSNRTTFADHYDAHANAHFQAHRAHEFANRALTALAEAIFFAGSTNETIVGADPCITLPPATGDQAPSYDHPISQG